MSIALESIIRAALRKDGEPLNLILMNSSEKYQSLLANTKHNFYLIGTRWNHAVSLFPENIKEINTLQYGTGYDAIICFGRYRGLTEAKSVSNKLHIPLILIELDYPNPSTEISTYKNLINYNIFVTKTQAEAWGFKSGYTLINNAVDIHPHSSQNPKRERRILTSLDNNWAAGLGIYLKYIKNSNLPTKIDFIHWQDLNQCYQNSLIYFSPATHIVQSLEILEAMAAGCMVVAIDNEFSREIITDKINGFLCTPENCFDKLTGLLKTKNRRYKLLKDWSTEMVKRYSLDKFVKSWNSIFDKAIRREI